MDNKFKWNIPNILSVYRLCILPALVWLVVEDLQKLFTLLFVISLITDILDGYIARKFKLQTPIGARLDSLADIGTVILGVTGMFRFEYTAIEPYLLPFLMVVFIYFSVIITALLKFRRISSLHLYSSKIAAYLQGIFFFILFCFGFNKLVFWIMFGVAIGSYLEELVILFLLKQLKENVKGIYWVLKSK